MSTNISSVRKQHHQSAHKLSNNSSNSSTSTTQIVAKQTRINHSTSFVIAKSSGSGGGGCGGGRDSECSTTTAAGGLGLDTCPKCGRQVCEHTSVADVINLPNSVSQDFSTYSSDSSLIKQLLSESTSSTGTIRSTTVNHHHHHRSHNYYYHAPVNRGGNQDYETIQSPSMTKLSIPMETTTTTTAAAAATSLMFSQILTQMSKQQQQQQQQSTNQSATSNPTATAMSNYITFNVLRPVSCQYVLDTETTDKLLKDFFESSNVAAAASTNNLNRDRLIGLVPSKKQRAIINPANKSNKSEKTTQTVDDVALIDNQSCVRVIVPSTTTTTTTTNPTTATTKRAAKKNKFAHFRLFNSHKNSTSSSSSASSAAAAANNNSGTTTTTTNKPLLRSTTNAFVNCLTSSSSSASSCEEIQKMNGSANNKVIKYTANSTSSSTTSGVQSGGSSGDEQRVGVMVKQPPIDRANKSTKQVKNLNQSVLSINSKFTNDLYDENDYNELHAAQLELCPIVANDDDDDDDDEEEDLDNKTMNRNKKRKLISKDESLISVQLNNKLSYQYEKKQAPNKSVSVSTITNEDEEEEEEEEEERRVVERTQPKRNPNKNKFIIDIEPNEVSNAEKTFTYRLKNRLSYFSSCSSCDSSSTPSTTHDSRLGDDEADDDNNTNALAEPSSQMIVPASAIRYHLISVIFILMGLFSLNLLQETYLLYYYFSTEQYYWFTYALVALFTGQVLTLILSLVAEVDSVGDVTSSSSSSSSSSSQASTAAVHDLQSSTSSTTTTTAGDLVRLTKADRTTDPQASTTSSSSSSSLNNTTNNNNFYRVFTNPFAKLALIVPGFLPLCVYAHFLRTLFEYRKSSALARFRLEFQLSIYSFLTALFFSLPVALLNSCYLASITKWGHYTPPPSPATDSSSSPASLLNHHTQPIHWYYTELLSVFTSSTFVNSSESSSESSSAESYSRVINHRQNTAAALPNELVFMHSHAKNQFLLVLVSIFISISIGICVFATYHELMKQNYEKIKQLRRRSLVRKPSSSAGGVKQAASRCLTNRRMISGEMMTISTTESTYSSSTGADLGLIEILVYFCYRFCLITSRLAVLALICYLFQHWLFVAIATHVLLTYLGSLTCLTFAKRDFTSKSSRLHKQLTLFIACLLSFVDLFASQLAEIANFRKIVAYYMLYLAQNVGVSTYWLVRTILDARQDDEVNHHRPENDSDVFTKNSNHTILVRSASSSLTSSSSSSFSSVSSTTTVCYATLVYLCIILFTLFGLILKFLHLHILRKRRRSQRV